MVDRGLARLRLSITDNKGITTGKHVIYPSLRKGLT